MKKNRYKYSSSLYKIGRIYGNDIFIDPKLEWNDDKISFTSNNFINFKIDEKSINTIVEGTFSPKIEISIDLKVEKNNSEFAKILNVKI